MHGIHQRMCNNQPAEQQKQARKLHDAFSKTDKTEGQEAASCEDKIGNLTTANLTEKRIHPMDNSMMTKIAVQKLC